MTQLLLQSGVVPRSAAGSSVLLGYFIIFLSRKILVCSKASIDQSNFFQEKSTPIDIPRTDFKTVDYISNHASLRGAPLIQPRTRPR
jgi:hypothetical protein